MIYLYDLPMDKHSPLDSIPPDQHAVFEIAADGAYIHWSHGDTHLDLEDIRFMLDPAHRRDAVAGRLAHDQRVGQAIAQLRREAGLRQADIAGLSDRQIRRYEHGDRPPLKAFRRLAAAHGLEVEEYLNRLASVCQSGRPRSVA